MPNAIKYSLSAQTLALKKGNFYIGTGDVGKGPTSTTDYYNGITPPSGGYTIYLNKASGGPSIYTASNDTQLVSLTNTISYITTNYISNGGNFSDGTISPFNSSYSDPGGVARVVSIANDKPYTGSTSTNALEFNYNAGSAFSVNGLLTVGQTYTFSFWAKVTSGTSFSIYWNNQNGSGETNNWSSGGFTVTTSWKRYSQVFTYNAARTTFYFYTRNQTVGTLAVFTEFQVSVGSAPCGPGLTTAAESINWFLTQTDKMVFNVDYPAIITNGLVMNLDAGFTPSITSPPTNIVGGGYNSYTPPWYDVGSGGNNGSLINGPTFSSANGGSIVFDGVDDYVTLSSSQIAPGTGAFTWNFWAKQAASANNFSIVFSGTGSNSFYGVISMDSRAGNGLIYYANGFRIQDFNTSFGANWWFISFVGNGGSNGARNLKLYRNAVQAGSTYTYDYNFTSTTPNIGANHSSYSELMTGNISMVSYYNRELSSAEITQNYNAQKGRFGL
jgi:hypothetical protein